MKILTLSLASLYSRVVHALLEAQARENQRHSLAMFNARHGMWGY